MTIFYADFTSGNNYYGGTSFNVLASGSNGRITGSTFSCATGNFPNDGSLIGQHLSIYNGTVDSSNFSGFINYVITGYISTTSLSIQAIPNGSGLANQASNRVFYIGGRWFDPWNVPSNNGQNAIRIRNTTEPGDAIRLMKSPDPVSLGSGTWEGLASTGVGVVRIATGITGVGNVEIITSGNHGYNTGDFVRVSGGITGTNGVYSSGFPFTITVTSSSGFTLDNTSGKSLPVISGNVDTFVYNIKEAVVTLPNLGVTGLTTNDPGLATASSKWIANTGITTQKVAASFADRINISSGFVTGMAAYLPFPSAVDLSSYQQISCLVQLTNPNLYPTQWGNSEQIQLVLCSGVSGNTPVHRVNLESIKVASNGGSGVSTICAKDFGSGLSNSINSLAIYINSDLSETQSGGVIISNVIAAKALASGGITHATLIGKNTPGETWYTPSYIFKDKVLLGSTSIFYTNYLPYIGSSETVTTYARDSFPVRASGRTSGLVDVLLQGGWDTTGMSTRVGETFLDTRNAAGLASGSADFGLSILDTSYMTGVFTQYISPVRCQHLMNDVNKNLWGNSGGIIINHYIAEVSSFGTNNGNANKDTISGSLSLPSYSGTNEPVPITVGSVFYCRNFYLGNVFVFQNDPGSIPTGSITITGDCIHMVRQDAGSQRSSYSVIGSGNKPNFSTNVNTSAAYYTNPGTTIHGTGALASTMENINFPIGVRASISTYLKNCTIGSGALLIKEGVNYFPLIIYTQEQSQVELTYGRIVTATDQRHTASGISWKLQPTNASGITSGTPLTLSLAKFACASGGQVTVSVYTRRDSTGITVGLICKGRQISGVPEDVVTYATGAVDTWEELTINFTPTQAGVVEVQGIAYGGSTNNAWFDDISVTQA